MVQKRPEISEFRDRINEYYKNMAEQMNVTYNRLSKIEAKISDISENINAIKETANADREEFEDTIHTLVESMKELVVPRHNPYANREYEMPTKNDNDKSS
jgi:uncharacterized protein YaaN involved in tellurite resistance